MNWRFYKDIVKRYLKKHKIIITTKNIDYIFEQAIIEHCEDEVEL